MKIDEGVHWKKYATVRHMLNSKAKIGQTIFWVSCWKITWSMIFEEEFSLELLLVVIKFLFYSFPHFVSLVVIAVLEVFKFFFFFLSSKEKYFLKEEEKGTWFSSPSINWDLFTPRFSRNGISTKRRYENISFAHN